jgi:S1-C subfamily serine protease
MEKIVISSREIAETSPPPDEPVRLEPKLPPAVPWWAKLALSPLVLVLPVLCLVAVVLRVAMRGLPPRTRFAWTGLLATLLSVSGLITSVAVVLVMTLHPLPSLIGGGLADLDERTDFPSLPVSAPLSARQASENLKPLVSVVSPARRTWFTHQIAPSAGFGAGTLLQADADGYLFATARHVVDGLAWQSDHSDNSVLVAMASGTWGEGQVVARHKMLDLALLWVKRDSGRANFVLPVAAATDVVDGATVFVIGHPEGLRFTLSTGIISRTDGDVLQMSAPVSPGNSGGPVFDDKGELVGVVTSMVDRHMDPNAENLNFAVRASALLERSNWDFSGSGKKRLDDYLARRVDLGSERQQVHRGN